ncbi:MAG: hypothetical protein ACI9W4_001769 [Rhodothermales bacterium]|jgi:hypothetical protein
MVLKKGLLTLGLALALTGCVLEANSPISSRASEAQDLVPETAAVVAFADARAVMDNMSSIVALDDSGEAAAAWDQVRAALGAINMDVERDLDFVVGYADGGASPVVSAVGSFDLEAIGDYLSEKLPQAKRTDLDGLTVWTMTEGSNQGAFGITEDGSRLVAAKDTDTIRRALDVRGGANLAEIAGPAMDNDTWVVARDVGSFLDKMGYDGSQQELMIRSVARVAAGGSLTSEQAAGTIVLHPKEGVEADDLAALMRGLVGAMRLQELPAEARAELEKIDVESVDGSVVVTGAVNRDLIESMIR